MPGRISRIKGQDVVVAALRRLPGAIRSRVALKFVTRPDLWSTYPAAARARYDRIFDEKRAAEGIAGMLRLTIQGERDRWSRR